MNGLCGCCQPPAPLTPLAIFNRPGLSAIAYRIGTYASFRESMLEAIATTPQLAGLGTRRDDDYSITILDLWAALADVLTFYQERYANEMFLRTAQQQTSLRRLAGLLGYNPRPGVAALADLAFTADSGKIIHAPAGLRVQSAPAQNQQPQTYETLEPSTVDWRLNRLRVFPKPAPWNPLQQGQTEDTLDRLRGPALAATLSAEDMVVIFNQLGISLPEEKKIKQTRVEDDRSIVTWTQPVQGLYWNGFSLTYKFQRKFRLLGFNVQSPWFHPVQDSAIPGGVAWVFDPLDFSLPSASDYYLDALYTGLAPGSLLMFVTPLPGGGIITTVRTVLQVDQAQRTFGPLSETVTHVTLDGPIADCADIRNSWIYELTGDNLSFWDSAYGSAITGGAVFMPGILVNDAQGAGVEVGRTIQQNAFVPGAVIHLQDVAPGRRMLLADSQNEPVRAVLHAPPIIDPAGALPGSFVHLVMTLDADSINLQTASAVLLGNVVSASQGETVANEIIGSGDASRQFQNFTLQKQPLTYVPGDGPDGVMSTLSVRVNGLLWQEVAGLYEQAPDAQVYSTSTSEDGRRAVQFGDGSIGGALLPTGQGNVSATYRAGAGIAGRVGPNALTTLLDRLQGLTGVTNPMSAEGGADPESLQTIRQNAPRTVRTFGRVVSLQDFADLITASGEVAKAEAIWVWDGLAPAVFMTVAGQDGGVFSDPASLAANLDNARDRNRRLLVGNYQPVPILVSATILTLPQYVESDVLASAHDALIAALSFDNLSLGQPVHLSGIYTALQDVPGVQAVDITLLAFRRPDGMSDAEFDAYLDARAVERLTNGTVAPVQGHLRIFSARTDPGVPGKVNPAELATIASPDQDIVLTAGGNG
jgi:uncharacterized phage protein gp47/JayE